MGHLMNLPSQVKTLHNQDDTFRTASALALHRGRAKAMAGTATQCIVLRSADEIARTAPRWRRLQERVRGDTQAFQTCEWSMAWLEAIACDDETRCHPVVVLITDASGEAQLIWPLMRENYPFGLKVLSPLTDPFGQYADILTVLEGERLEQALRDALAALRNLDADLLRLRYVRTDSALGRFAQKHFCTTGENIGAPWLDLEPFEKPEDLDKRYNRSQRRRRRKIRKKLEEHFGTELTFERVTDPQEACRHVEEALLNKRRWLDEKGFVSRALFRRETEKFLCGLARHSRDHRQGMEFCLTVLKAGEKAISWEIGVRYHGRHYAYITAHRPELTDLSVGRLHMDLSQKQAVADGMKAFDLLVPNDPHKRSWSSHVQPVQNFFLPLTLRGSMAGHGYLRYARALMRRVYYALPGKIRQQLQEWKHGPDMMMKQAGDVSRKAS